MNTKTEIRAISHLFGDALSQFAKLFQNEVDLAKAELGESRFAGDRHQQSPLRPKFDNLSLYSPSISLSSQARENVQ